MKIYKEDIIEGRLSVSYEEASEEAGVDYPAAAVLLLTRCCEANHEHISLTHAQGAVLAQWLDEFVNGDYDG